MHAAFFIFYFFEYCKLGKTRIMAVLLALADNGIDMVYSQDLTTKEKDISWCDGKKHSGKVEREVMSKRDNLQEDSSYP